MHQARFGQHCQGAGPALRNAILILLVLVLVVVLDFSAFSFEDEDDDENENDWEKPKNKPVGIAQVCFLDAALTERPDLFKAVVCGSPLLDMRRFNHLLAGASWMDEYGDPDKPEEWAWISRYSPYQNLVKGKRYPRVLFTTSTRDDRVHPGHARKMAARMEEQDHDVLYYENIEGGHAGAADNKQSAYMAALAYTFLIKDLGA